MAILMAEPAHLISTVRKWLSASNLEANQRLPPERELAAKFCVSRAELRKALAVLEDQGVIRRHVGRGTFVTRGTGAATPDEGIAAKTSPLAAMQARSVIEPELARLAALSATSAQIAEMRRLCTDMRRSTTWETYAELDWLFHNVLAEATGNVLLAEIQRILNNVRRYVVWGNLLKRPVGPPSDYHSFGEHEAIVDAIAERDSERARRTMLEHLGGTKSHLADFLALDDAQSQRLGSRGRRTNPAAAIGGGTAEEDLQP